MFIISQLSLRLQPHTFTVMSWKLLARPFSMYRKQFTKTASIHRTTVPNFAIRRFNLSETKSPPVITTSADRQFQEKLFNIPGGDSSNPDKDTAIRNMKYTFLFLGLSLTAVGSYVILVLGRPSEDENGQTVVDEYSNSPVWQQYVLRGLRQIRQFAIFIQQPSRDKLLPDPLTYPYYQPPYTLVLEFTDVLAHPEWTYQTGWRFKKRPGVDYMLENLAGLYEIVVFTAEPGITIFPVIEALDQRGLISYKLVRDSTHFIDGHHVKNLENLNRDLTKVIVVDWNSKSVKLHSDNHFAIERWAGGDDDNTLVELTAFLKAIAETDIEDVREVLKFYKQFENPLDTFQQKRMEYMEKQKHTQDKPIGQPQDSVKRFLRALL